MPLAIDTSKKTASTAIAARPGLRRAAATLARMMRTLGGTPDRSVVVVIERSLQRLQQRRVSLQEEGRLVVDDRLVRLQRAQEAVEARVVGVGFGQQAHRLGLARAADRLGLGARLGE